jgi:hypothetical protein
MSNWSGNVGPQWNLKIQHCVRKIRPQIFFSLSLSLSLWHQSPLRLGCVFSFLILYTVCRTPWAGDQPVARPLPKHKTTQRQNKRTQTSTPRVTFEPTTPVFEREKIVNALTRAATVTGASGTYFESVPPVWPCNKIFPSDILNYYYFPFCSLAFQTVSLSLGISC